MLYSYIYFFCHEVHTLTAKMHFKHTKLHLSCSYFCPFYIRIHYFPTLSYAFLPAYSSGLFLSSTLLHTNSLFPNFFVCFSFHLFSDFLSFLLSFTYESTIFQLFRMLILSSHLYLFFSSTIFTYESSIFMLIRMFSH